MRWVAIAAGMSALAVAAPAAAQTRSAVEVTQSRTLPLTAQGMLKMDGSWGEVDVQAWDRPEVELVMVTRSKDEYAPDQAEKVRERLNRFTFEAKAPAPGLVEVTGHSPEASLLKPFGGKSGVNVRYAIRMPRSANLVLHHGVGTVKVANVGGNVDVANNTGSIDLAIPLDDNVAVETSARVGDVDLPAALRQRGTYKQKALVGHSFDYRPASAQRRVIARVGVGSVSIN